MLRQFEWGAKNRPITENGVLPLTTSFSYKYLSQVVNVMYHLPKYPYEYFL